MQGQGVELHAKSWNQTKAALGYLGAGVSDHTVSALFAN